MVDFRRFCASILLAFALVAAPAVIFTGCIHHDPNLTPAQNTQLNLYTALDVITTANKELTRSMIALDAAGAVPKPVTRAVLDYAQQISDASRGALAVLDSNQTPAQKAAAVLSALKKLDLPPPVADFVNSNPNAAAVISIINTIVEVQRAITEAAATPIGNVSTKKQGAI